MAFDASAPNGRTKSLINIENDPRIIVWTKLQVPPGEELGTNQWAAYFQPLVHTVGHDTTVWARVQESPNIIILATCTHPISSPITHTYTN
jgi:hypothetical protein